MKRLFLILVVMAFAVSSAVAKGKEKEKAPKCTITLADGKTVSGYWIDIKIKARPVGANNANVVLTMTIADTPDAKTGTEYSADDAVRFVAREGKDSVEYLSLYGQKAMTMPKSLKPGKSKYFWRVVYKKEGLYAFAGSIIETTPNGSRFGFDRKQKVACFYSMEGENVVVPFWSPTEPLTIGAKNPLRYAFARFPKVVEYINSKEFKIKMIDEDPLGFLDKVVELK